MASFVEKLRLSNLYPSIPRPRNRNRYPMPIDPIPPMVPIDRMEEIFAPQGMRPNIVEPTRPMNVVYQPSIGDQGREMAYVRDVHGIDLNKNALSPYQAGQLQLRDRALDIADTTAKTKSQTEAKKIAIAEYKAKNPNAKIIAQKGGNIKAVHPVTGEVIADFGPTGEMDDASRIALEQAGKIEAIRETGSQTRENIATSGQEARKTEDVRQAGRMKIEEFKHNNKDFKFIEVQGGNIVAIDPTDPSTIIDTGISSGTLSDKDRLDLQISGSKSLEELRQSGRETLAGLSSKSGQLPSQQRTATLAKAEQAKNTHPEWSSYIKIVPGGGFAVTAPGVLTGPSAEVYKQITDFIYGTTAPKASEKPKPQSKYQVTVK